MRKTEYSVSGYPAFFLCMIPMLLGYFVIVRAVVEYLF